MPTTKLTDRDHELATYNITFEWISGTKNKTADCLSRLVEQFSATPAMIIKLTVTHTDGLCLQHKKSN